MNVEELERLLEDAYRTGLGNRFKEMSAMAPDLLRRVIVAEKLVEATGELCRRVEQQQNGWPMRADYIPNALLPAQEAVAAYEATK